MATNISAIASQAEGVQEVRQGAAILGGRILFSLLFLLSSIGHFSPQTVAYAASQGLPFAYVLVPLSGVLLLAAGASLLLGYRAKLGAWLAIVFLIPATLIFHKFWGIADPAAAQGQMVHFLKNLSLMGAALLITQFGSGPMSLDSRKR